MRLSTEIDKLAEAMFQDQATLQIDGWSNREVTFYYLPVEMHKVHSGMRGFGMKVSLSHLKGQKPTLHCLKQELRNRWGK